MSGMHDEALSQAVVAYIWGDHRQPWPSAHPDAVHACLGDQAIDLIPRVQTILDEIHNQPQRWFATDLAAMGQRVDRALRDSHPELTDAAVDSLTAHFTYMWR